MKSRPDTLAEVVGRFLPVLNSQTKLPTHTLRTIDAIQKCRTPYMGGHVEACSSCGEVRTAYNSCRNRHCPQCGAIEKEKWIMGREADLLPVKYFHVVFTYPTGHEHILELSVGCYFCPGKSSSSLLAG